MKRNLFEILRGGYCTRWHANPDLAHIRETLAEHHARVAQIILALHPSPTIKLIDAALHHDAGEPVAAGDVPSLAKQENPDLARLLDFIEGKARRGLGIDIDPFPEDLLWLKFADQLSAYCHVAHVSPQVLKLTEWRRSRDNILSAAVVLQIRSDVIRVCPALAERDGISQFFRFPRLAADNH